MAKPKQGIARLLEISAQKPWHLAFAVLFSSISGVLQFMPYFASFKVIEVAASHYGSLSDADVQAIMGWVVFGVVCVGLGFVFMYAGSLCSHIAAYRILYGLRIGLAKKLTELPQGFHAEHSTGAIRKILELNVEKVERFIAHALPDYVSGIVGFLVILVLLFGINVWLTLVFLVVVVVTVFIATRWASGERGKENVRKYQDALERINSSAVQYVTGMPAVKVFNRSAESFQSFKRDIYNYQHWALRASKDFRPVYTIGSAVIKGIALFVLPVGTLLLQANPSSLAYALNIFMFLILAPGIVAPIFKVVGIGSVMQDIAVGVERIDAIFNTTPLAEPSVSIIPQSFDVRFANVRFSYYEGSEGELGTNANRQDGVAGDVEDRRSAEANQGTTSPYALRGVSFSAPEGEITALVGPSGSGKSTCAQLIARFWDIRQGQISIGGVDVKDIGQDDLNELVSYVFQDCFMFFDSIAANIRAGKTEASAAEVVAAAKAAQCHDFISALPEGYDTLIGEGGIHLSGGEEQRINIARAILKDSPVLVLDEATAFADPENEALLYSAIRSLIQDKTVLMIAHRLSTIVGADQIIVMDEGRVAEKGTHASLLAAQGLYAKLYAAYMASTEWTVAEGAR